MDGAGERTSGEVRLWSVPLSEDSRCGSGAAKLANREWKWAGAVAYNGAPNRDGRDSGGKYWAPKSGVFAYL